MAPRVATALASTVSMTAASSTGIVRRSLSGAGPPFTAMATLPGPTPVADRGSDTNLRRGPREVGAHLRRPAEGAVDARADVEDTALPRRARRLAHAHHAHRLVAGAEELAAARRTG